MRNVRPGRSVAALLALITGVAALVVVPAPASALPVPADRPPIVQQLASFAAPGCVGGCGSGSTIGPDRALYVTDGPAGRVLRIDPTTGATSTFAEGLPRALPAIGIGGAMDVVFLGGAAYVLVTLVGPEFGQPDVVSGIYRIGRNGRPSVVADLGVWSAAHPPATDFFIASGVQYALERSRGKLMVTDGHHNRVLTVSKNGKIRELRRFANVVPTGLEVTGRTVLVAEAGPIPHLPKDGRVVAFRPRVPAAAVALATGAPLLVDVELGRDGKLYALSQGDWLLPPTPENEGRPAEPDTGRLLVARGGLLVPVVLGLDRPTSFELVGDDALVVTLTGRVLRISGRCR